MSKLLNGTVEPCSFASAQDPAAARSFFDPSPESVPRRKRFRTHCWNNFSPKLGRRVCLYQQIGLDHWVLVEANPDVIWYTERPRPITLRTGRHDVTCRFDLVLEYRTGSIECRRLFGVASLDELRRREMQAIERERHWCHQLGYQYGVITMRELAGDRMLIQNWLSMLPWVREPNDDLDPRILSLVSAPGELTLGELDVLLADVDRESSKRAVYSLLHRGRLRSDDLREAPVSADTRVEVSHGY